MGSEAGVTKVTGGGEEPLKLFCQVNCHVNEMRHFASHFGHIWLPLNCLKADDVSLETNHLMGHLNI